MVSATAPLLSALPLTDAPYLAWRGEVVAWRGGGVARRWRGEVIGVARWWRGEVIGVARWVLGKAAAPPGVCGFNGGGGASA
eukprot:2435003-Prymnesium_polylepis.1